MGTLQEKLVWWYTERAKVLPWRQRWEQSRDPYVVWVSEIMLQQTQIAVVIPAYQRFLGKFPNISDLSAASEDEVRLACRGLGYYRRFAFLHKAVRQLTSPNRWTWPQNSADWQKLPGIGRYTSAAIASICFNEPIAAVDGNVERIVCRLQNWPIRLQDPKTKPKVTAFADRILDPKDPGTFNQALMELGQDICLKSKPLCKICPIKEYCLAKKLGTQESCPAPALPKKQNSVSMKLIAITEGKSKLALVRRPDDAKFLKNVPGLLTQIQGITGSQDWDGSMPISKAKFKNSLEIEGSFEHTITNHKIHVTLAIVTLTGIAAKSLPSDQVEWVKFSEANQKIVANLDRKAWNIISAFVGQNN